MRRYLISAAGLLVLIILIMSVVWGYLGAPTVKAQATLSRRTALVGDKVRYTIKVIADSRADVEIPNLENNLSGFEIVDKGSYEKDFFGKRRIAMWYSLAQYMVGEYTIPKVEVRYKREDGATGIAETNEVGLTVKSVLDKKMKEDLDFTVKIGGALDSRYGPEERGVSRKVDTPIRLKIIDTQGPLNLITYSDVGISTLVTAGLVLAAFFAFRFVRGALNKPKVVSPYELAVKQLEDLSSRRLQEKGLFRELYFDLSSILRSYVKSVMDIGSSELTTREFLGEIEKSTILTDAQKKELKDMILLCDLVKFSGYTPKGTEQLSSLDSAKRIIDALHDMARPKEAST